MNKFDERIMQINAEMDAVSRRYRSAEAALCTPGCIDVTFGKLFWDAKKKRVQSAEFGVPMMERPFPERADFLKDLDGLINAVLTASERLISRSQMSRKGTSSARGEK